MVRKGKDVSVPLYRYRTLSWPLRFVFLLFSICGVLAAIYQLFHFNFLGVMAGNGYYYLLIALFLPLSFLIFPAYKNCNQDQVPWYDLLFATLAFATAFYFYVHCYEMVEEGWEIMPPSVTYVVGLILGILILEAARRAGGNLFALICILLALYPLFAHHMPGIMKGYSVGLRRLVGFFTMATEGLVGLPMRVVGKILIGYMVFLSLIHI